MILMSLRIYRYIVVNHKGLLSHNIPLATMLIAGKDLMSLPPNLRVGISTEFIYSIHDLILQSVGTAIADDMEHTLPNSSVLIINHFEDPLPEDIDVSLNLAWT
jgi:hypothetical protein